MGKTITLKASDGHEFDAYRADPSGSPKGGVVVIQEIFGVNSHIRGVADGYAAEGYVAVAPAVFDRHKKSVELGYTQDDIQAGFQIVSQHVTPNMALLDIQAAVDLLHGEGLKVGVVGYCWGGTMAWLSASRLDNVAAVSAYYGGQVARNLDETPKAPIILHFGALDKGIPLTDVDKLKAAHPDLPVHVYENADHGFNCDQRASFNEEAAKLARERTLALFAQKVAA